MRTVCKPGHPVPYSLHDMRVSDITLSDGQLTLQFETGLVRIAEPCVQVGGRVVLTGGGILRSVAAQSQWGIREFFREKTDLGEVFPEASGVLL